MPKLSVIVPIYGVEDFLHEAIDSIINQSLEDIEIILVDDGGKDSCPQIIDGYAEKDNRIKVIHKDNGGYGQTCNIGIKHSSGEYIAIFEPDDFIEKDMYKDLYKIAKENDCDIVKSPYYTYLQTPYYTETKKINWKKEDKCLGEVFTIKDSPSFLFYHPSIWSAIYKKDFIIKNKILFTEVPGAGWTDNLFQVQTMCLAKKICYTDKAYYYWRKRTEIDSDDLKDYSIPFKRSDEIHNWLTEKNINDENIICQLNRRELCYISIILGMSPKLIDENCFIQVQKMLERMHPNLKKHLNKKEEAFFEQLKISPKKVHKKLLRRNIRRKILQIKLNKTGLSVKFFGRLFNFPKRVLT